MGEDASNGGTFRRVESERVDKIPRGDCVVFGVRGGFGDHGEEVSGLLYFFEGGIEVRWEGRGVGGRFEGVGETLHLFVEGG